jgi:predicted kinase
VDDAALEQELQRPKFLMMVGTIAAGKSTWSESLIKRGSDNGRVWIKLSVDEMRDAFVQKHNVATADVYDNPELYQSYEEYILQNIRDALQTGDNILFDGTNPRRSYRHRVLSLVNEAPHPYHKTAVLVVPTPEEAEAQLRERSEKKQISPEDRDALIEKLHLYNQRLEDPDQKLGLDEGFDMIVEIPSPSYVRKRWTATVNADSPHQQGTTI